MISISRQADYACRVILHLSMLPSAQRVTAQDIARRRIIPRALVRRIITRLSKAQLVATVRGNGGGISLARPSSDISMLDVVQAMEGEIALNACTVNPDPCPLLRGCPVHEEWVQARDLLLRELAQATFDKLAARGQVLAV